MHKFPLWAPLVLPLVLLPGAGYTKGIAQPPLQLAADFQQQDASLYRVSEKLDGVRAYWNGSQLISRSGHYFSAPDWFIADFPNTPLDGELWIGRGQFDAVSAAVRRYQAVDSEWRTIRFMVFDLPASTKPFEVRLKELKPLIADAHSAYLRLVDQQLVKDNAALAELLKQIDEGGGEGLMLRHRQSIYQAGRNQDLLKLKQFQDAEAQVVAHLPGLGKYQGMLGALLVETPDGRRFKLGTGFSDLQREQPPPIGSIVTYRYQGETGQQLPRFASFMRVRQDQHQ